MSNISRNKKYNFPEDKSTVFIDDVEFIQRKMFFLANLNHELKSPLNAILGFSQLLKERMHIDKNLEQYKDLIENIMEGVNHLNSIVFRILKMAKIESGTLELNEEPIVPSKLIQLSINIVFPLYPKRKIRVEMCEAASKENLSCDKNLAMEVLINLLMNSLKFSDDAITIKCLFNKDKDLEFLVSDSGIGMSDAEIKIAMEPFGQNLRSPHDKNTGLGLGVPFSSQIMKLHGGDLVIKSKKGRGTTACARFPAFRIKT